MLKLYANAVFYKPKATQKSEHNAQTSVPILPSTNITKTVTVSAEHCQKYNRLCEWQPKIASLIHPNYIQTLSMPLQLSLMVEQPFPFKPIGVVHIANEIEVNQLPEQASTLRLLCYFGKVYFHKRGWLFEVITHAFDTSNASNTPAVVATSYYLARAKHGADTEHLAACEPQLPAWISNDVNENQTKTAVGKKTLKFDSNIGRKYAKISGDYNPIHLFASTAKFFGFNKAIAHGMYSKARAASYTLSSIETSTNILSKPFVLRCSFVQAIFLPANTQLNVFNVKQNSEAGQGVNFSLVSIHKGEQKQHLSGSIHTI